MKLKSKLVEINKTLKVPIFNHPHAAEINPPLYTIISDLLITNLGNDNKPAGSRTDWDLHQRQIKEIDELLLWIGSLIPQVHYYLDPLLEDHEYNFDDTFAITHLWGIHYNKGEGIKRHTHYPFTFTFNYYVNTPSGSSSITIENKEIQVAEGQCVFIPPAIAHSVSSSINKRCAIAGNVLYVPHVANEQKN